MINIKSSQDIATMARGGKILAKILKELSESAQPGVTTQALEQLARELVLSYKVKPAFLGYPIKGHVYPAVLCTSVNEEVVHSPPSDRTLNEGDIVGLDIGIVYEGWNLDSTVTVAVSFGNRSSISAEIATLLSLPAGRQVAPSSSDKLSLNSQQQSLNKKLVSVAQKALQIGIKQAKVGNHVGAISHAVQAYVERNGFGVVRDLVGHGIGREVHEEPAVPNFGSPHDGPELKDGMVICIEPMITAGDWHLELGKDGWTYRTKDGSCAAHFEHTVAITPSGPRILTKL